MNVSQVNNSLSVIHKPGEGKVYTIGSETVTLKVSGKDSGGVWTVFEFAVPPNFSGPPMHWHKVEMEGFYILSGTITLQIEDDVFKASAGSFAFVPAGVVHTFSNQEDVSASFLSFLSPSGLEFFFDEMADMMSSETTWPPADMGKYQALNLKYGIYPASVHP